MESALESVHSQIPAHEGLSKLVVTTDAWEIADGLLMPTMKIKRAALEMLGPGSWGQAW